MAEARKAFRLTTLKREEQRLINEINHHENQLETELNDSKREELILKLKINGLELEINGYKIDLENAATDEERIRKEKQIETKELLLLRLLPSGQQIQASPPGKLNFDDLLFIILLTPHSPIAPCDLFLVRLILFQMVFLLSSSTSCSPEWKSWRVEILSEVMIVWRSSPELCAVLENILSLLDRFVILPCLEGVALSVVQATISPWHTLSLEPTV